MGLVFDPNRATPGRATPSSWWRCGRATCSSGSPSGRRTDDVIAGLDAAWAFFGGVFPILIPDNLSPVVTKADAIEPRFNDTFFEYAQSRGS